MIVELQKAFKDYKFTESNHSYVNTETGEELISVTGLLKKLRPEFDSEYRSTVTALKRNGYTVYDKKPFVKINNQEYVFEAAKMLAISPTAEEVRNEWSIAALIGQTLGTYLHNRMENNILRKVINQDVPKFVFGLSSIETIRYLKNRETLDKMADKFYSLFIDHYTPIVTEFIVGDASLNIAGTFDLLAVDNETNEVVLWDYKTDKEIKRESKYNNNIDVFNIDDCELNKYSLQLSIYKYLIEKNTNIKISHCKIAHFDYRYEEINIIDTLDFTNEVKEFFENDDNKSIYFGYKTANKRKR